MSVEGMLAVDFRLPNPKFLNLEFTELMWAGLLEREEGEKRKRNKREGGDKEMGKRTFAVLESSGVGLGFWGGLSTRQTDSMLPCLTTPKGTVKNKSRRLTKKGERGTGEERGVAESVLLLR